MLPVLGDFVGGYLFVLLLKIFSVPGIKNIQWKWFLIIPFLYFFIKLIWPFIDFAWNFAVGILILAGIAYGGLWIFSL